MTRLEERCCWTAWRLGRKNPALLNHVADDVKQNHHDHVDQRVQHAGGLDMEKHIRAVGQQNLQQHLGNKVQPIEERVST